MRNLFMLLLFYSCMVHAQENSWYKRLEGNIEKYPVVMHLHKAGSLYHGYYYYQSSQQPLSLLGEDTSRAGFINLFVTSAEASASESFRFAIKGNRAQGVWHVSDKEKDLPFTAWQTTDPLAMRFHYLRAEMPLKSSVRDSPEASYEAAVVWPATEQGGGAALRKEVLDFFAKKGEAREPAGVLRQARDAFFSNYGKNQEEAKPGERTAMPSAFTNNKTQRAMVAYQGKTLLSIALFSYSFTGGAHGNYGTAFRVFNLEAGTKLTLKDVLAPEGFKALPELLAAAFRKKQGLAQKAPLTQGGLFENKIKPTDNFLLTGKAIGFSFVPYEIGPYALGEITIYLPYKEVAPYLQPSFVNILKKN